MKKLIALLSIAVALSSCGSHPPSTIIEKGEAASRDLELMTSPKIVINDAKHPELNMTGVCNISEFSKSTDPDECRKLVTVSATNGEGVFAWTTNKHDVKRPISIHPNGTRLFIRAITKIDGEWVAITDPTLCPKDGKCVFRWITIEGTTFAKS